MSFAKTPDTNKDRGNFRIKSMARILGVELQDNWKIDYALTNIKGIGWALSGRIIKELGIDQKKRISDLSTEEISQITSAMEQFPVEGELVRQVRANVTRLQTIGAYKGIRHSRGLPARGQRTRRNARAKRGKRKTVGAFKKEALAKMQTSK
jgi:small subunit ribosomal protein S13